MVCKMGRSRDDVHSHESDGGRELMCFFLSKRWLYDLWFD